MSWLLMPWLLMSPGHQQPWHWIHKMEILLSSLRVNFNNNLQSFHVIPRNDMTGRYIRADCRFVLSQWETSLQSNTVSHWLGSKLESAPNIIIFPPSITAHKVLTRIFHYNGIPLNIMPGLIRHWSGTPLPACCMSDNTDWVRLLHQDTTTAVRQTDLKQLTPKQLGYFFSKRNPIF